MLVKVGRCPVTHTHTQTQTKTKGHKEISEVIDTFATLTMVMDVCVCPNSSNSRPYIHEMGGFFEMPISLNKAGKF